MVQVGDTVLAIVKIIMREVWGVGDDEDAGSVMPRIAGWAADAILAAGLLDRTGALLTRAAELAAFYGTTVDALFPEWNPCRDVAPMPPKGRWEKG